MDEGMDEGMYEGMDEGMVARNERNERKVR